jgi:hypothetical protein
MPASRSLPDVAAHALIGRNLTHDAVAVLVRGVPGGLVA